MKACLAVFILVVCVALMSSSAWAGEIRGKVVSVIRGEPLRQVEVSVLELKTSVHTAADGSFALSNLPNGKLTVRVSAVGYRLVTVPVELTAGADQKEVSVTLAPDNFRRTETVEVKGDLYQLEGAAVPGQLTLNAAELKEASTVLANDPFRAVQSLPGVSATQNNDFFAQISVMGAPSGKVSIYFDDVLVRQPFHTLLGIADGASLSVVSSETVESVNLMPVAFPERFGDATGGALQLQTRDGSRTHPLFTVSASLADSEATGEGQLGSARKGSWLVSARKSYLGYLVRRSGGDPFTDIAFEDGSLRLTYDLTPRNNITFYTLNGHTDINRTVSGADPNELTTGGSDFTLVRLGWRSVITPHLLVETHGVYVRQSSEQKNPSDQLLSSEYYGEWVGGTRTTWSWREGNILEAGYTARQLRDGQTHFVFFTDQGPFQIPSTNATGLRQSGYAQQASSFFHQRLHLLAGLRWDRLEQVGGLPVSPQVSGAFQLLPRTQIQFGYGRYAQLPDISSLTCFHSPIPVTVPVELWERSTHYTVGLEQRFGDSIRFQVQGFDRENHPVFGGRALTPTSCGPLVRDPRSANRLSGWIGYTLDYAHFQIPVNTQAFAPTISGPTEQEQRHTLNIFANYRLRPSINLSGKFLYGSGFPVTSLTAVQSAGGLTIVGVNSQRLTAYQRLDARIDKSWAFARWKMTLQAEVLNLTNHNNPRVIGSVFDPVTLRPIALVEKGLPVLPVVGVSFQF